ncbi:probable membrane-associated kinase regulator 2 isoform X2 [Rhodamnia argentea]|uniref:Probable membrane-associated kinase regulator 2 isoform X2 n=1 Tax=Rhodamnia argentea TaxID=178133 RepID=A0A8B8P6F3_9MYRT|nr:probable membrane-associated kinase regulator 2 isoform X2 [Rhodamnia argentea]
MEAFSLLKYWRGGGGGGGDPRATSVPATTIFASAVSHSSPETDDDDDGGDDGPFFDLEFAPVPDDEDDEEKPEEEERRKQDEPSNDEDDSASECGGGDEDGDDVDREFDFTLSSGSSGSSHDCTDANIASSLSPSDDLFFKGKLVPIEPSDPDSSKPPSFAAASSLLKSATKFRVFMLGLKKPKPMNTFDKSEKAETSEEPCLTVTTPPRRARAQEHSSNKQSSSSSSNKFFTVKFNADEVPLVSLFTRDNSSRSASGAKPPQKQASEEDAASGDERRFAREAMRRYLKKVKPFYIRVSKRYGERLGLSGQIGHAVFDPTVGEKSRSKASAVAEVRSGGHGRSQRQGQGQGNSSIPAGLRVVCKHLGKSRSASSAVAAAPGGQAAAPGGQAAALAAASRRDDSLLQQQDGIQSAILHCKRSFNASRDSESSLLARSASDPLRKDASRSSSEDGK